MVSFEMQLHELNREMALRITKMLTAKHCFTITELYGDLSKSPAETKERYLYVTNEWGPETPSDLQGLAERENAAAPKNIHGMSPGRCPI